MDRIGDARNLNENLENNLQLESFSVSSVCSVDYYHRNLDGIYTETKSLKKILNKMRSSSSLLGRILLWIALQARNLK